MTAHGPQGFTGPTATKAKLAWQRDAICRDNPELFWATTALQQGLARHMCLTHCPVLDQCRAWAPDADLAESVAAGLAWAKDRDTGASRPSLRQPAPVRCGDCGGTAPSRARAEVAACGTRSGYVRHLRNRDPHCPACWRANADYQAARRIPKGPTSKPVPATSQVLELRPCGTHAAYVRHKANGQPVDEACLKAERDYDAAKKRARAKARRAGVAA
jgi:hypothetical protein